MPRGVYKMRCQTQGRLSKPLVLQPHQQSTVEAFLNSPYKGLLLYHKLGSGKTCVSIVIADELLKAGKINHVYILTPGSLRQPWVNEYCSKCGSSPDSLEKNYTFITYNYSVKEVPDFTGGLVIVDEIHNLINGKKNNSKFPSFIYDTIDNCDCRVLALSGTPVFQYLYEFPILMNLLKKGFFKSKKYKDYDLEFIKDKDDNLTPRNPEKFKESIQGIISYFPGGSDLPRVIDYPPLQFQMSREQEQAYWEAVVKEELAFLPQESLRFSNPDLYLLAKRLYIMSRKRIMSRKASNFYYPEETLRMKDRYWIKPELFANRKLATLYSPKIAGLLVNILLHPGQKHIVFSFFKKKSGVHLIKTLFDMCGVKTKIFTGDLNDEERKHILKEFNDKKNRYGANIPVLLFSSAGAEGISLTDVRHIHILESDPRMNKTVQSIGRAVRFKSHENLPENKRTVSIWKYWSVPSTAPITVKITTVKDGKEKIVEKTITNKEGMDEKLYNEGKSTVRSLDSFLEFLKKESVN